MLNVIKVIAIFLQLPPSKELGKNDLIREIAYGENSFDTSKHIHKKIHLKHDLQQWMRATTKSFLLKPQTTSRTLMHQKLKKNMKLIQY